MKKEYQVARPHIGDKKYAKGDPRIADPRKVAHLVKSGALIDPSVKGTQDPDEGGEKAAPPIANRAQPKTKNKASGI